MIGQSDMEAYLWARKAALAGLAKAEYAMGYFTEVGIGAPADLEAAKRWYWRAACEFSPFSFSFSFSFFRKKLESFFLLLSGEADGVVFIPSVQLRTSPKRESG